MSDEIRLARIEDKLDKIIEANSQQNERIARIEASQKVTTGFTVSAVGAAFAALLKAFFGGIT